MWGGEGGEIGWIRRHAWPRRDLGSRPPPPPSPFFLAILLEEFINENRAAQHSQQRKDGSESTSATSSPEAGNKYEGRMPVETAALLAPGALEAYQLTIGIRI